MRRENILIGMVAVLIVLNGCILFYFLNKEQGHGEPGSPPPPRDRVIIETLQLDREQEKQFEQLKIQHRESMLKINRQTNQLLEQYFSGLRQNTIIDSDSIENLLADLERQRVSITFAHFEDIKNLCHADQKEKFDKFLPKLIEFVMPRSNNNRNLPPPERRNQD